MTLLVATASKLTATEYYIHVASTHTETNVAHDTDAAMHCLKQQQVTLTTTMTANHNSSACIARYSVRMS